MRTYNVKVFNVKKHIRFLSSLIDVNKKIRIFIIIKQLNETKI